MNEWFRNAVAYDEPNLLGNWETVNRCDLAFACVPMPMGSGSECDTSIVEDVLSWLSAKMMVLRSTVSEGFTDEFSEKLGKRILFQPEYYGETIAYHFSNPHERAWITLGGEKEYLGQTVRAYQHIFSAELIIHCVDARMAELTRYMKNAFLTTKVTFCNEFYDLAQRLGVDYNAQRENWHLDPRIGRSHTFVYSDNRGYGGFCLPEDISTVCFDRRRQWVLMLPC